MTSLNSHMFSEQAFSVWRAELPMFTSTLEMDGPKLSAYLKLGEGWIAKMEQKLRRTSAQQDQARQIHEVCRLARTRFLSRHAAQLYRRLTLDGTRRPQLAALAYDAAELVPFLVPDFKEMERERSHAQSAKEGREIDQGILFAAFFASREVGQHLLEAMLAPSLRALDLLDEFSANGVLCLEALHVERRGESARLTIHNESCLNAEDITLISDMEVAVDLALLDPKIKVGLLRGGQVAHPKYAGRRVFSAGINLKHLRDGKIPFVEFLLQREVGYINKMLRGCLVSSEFGTVQIEKPWVAAVDSFAIGGGAQIVLVCDRVIGASDSYFSLPAAREGIIPGVANLRLTRMVGARLARQIVLGGRRIFAEEAAAAAIFDDVVDSSVMDDVIERNLVELSAPAVIANRHMLISAEEPIEALRNYMAEFSSAQALRLYSSDVIGKL